MCSVRLGLSSARKIKPSLLVPTIFLSSLMWEGKKKPNKASQEENGPLPSGFESGLFSLFLFFRFPCTHETMLLKTVFFIVKANKIHRLHFKD